MKASPVIKKPKAVRSNEEAELLWLNCNRVSISARPLVLLRATSREDRLRRRRDVFDGKDTKTWGGMKKEDLRKNKDGKVVSKKLSKQGQKRCWPMAIAAARVALDLTGFVAIKKGSALYKKARQIYNIMKTSFEEMPLLYRCDFPC
jgi:hypothetical protein